MKCISLHAFFFAKDYRPMSSRWQRAPYIRKFGHGLVLKPAISVNEILGSYRSKTWRSMSMHVQRKYFGQ